MIRKNSVSRVMFLPLRPRCGNSPVRPALVPIRGGEHTMNQQLRRSAQVLGLKLTDAQPLSGIPAVWRLGAIISTLLMGFLAFIAALYFGRPVLLPVVAAPIVGITLSPLIEFGARYKIPAAVSAIVAVAVGSAVVGV